MAIFSDQANRFLSLLKEAKSLYYGTKLTDAQVNDIRLEIGRWADQIGKANSKEFKTPNGLKIKASAENHEVTKIEFS
jgi:hypothetical protein